MAKAKKKAAKKRADKYDEKVSFDGSVEDLIKLSVSSGNLKPVKKENKKNNRGN